MEGRRVELVPIAACAPDGVASLRVSALGDFAPGPRTTVALTGPQHLDFTLPQGTRGVELEGTSEGRTVAPASRGTASAILFRWIVRIGLEDCAVPGEDGSVRALLFSGSGDPGLPAGLLIGAAALPLDAKSGEERTIELENSVEPRDVGQLFVRRLPPADVRGGRR